MQPPHEVNDAEHAVAIANAMLKALDFDGGLVARGLCHLAVTLADNPAAKAALAKEMLQLAKQIEPRLPLCVRWH
jgi:hypothetical protein